MKDKSNLDDGFGAFGQTRVTSESGVRSFSSILQEILNHLAEILHSEVRLARKEVWTKVTQVASAGVFVGIGAILALYALGFILLGVVEVIATQMPLWLSAVIVGAGLTVVAAIFYQVGRGRVKQAMREPSATIQSVQENLRWMKERSR